MIYEMFLWWLLYGLVFIISAVVLSVAKDFDSWVLGGCILVLFIVPFNGVYFSAMYSNFYLKWFI